MFIVKNHERLKERSFEFVIIKTYNSFENENKPMIGVRRRVLMEKKIDTTLYFVSYFLFSILYRLKLFSYYCRYCIVVTMDFGKDFFWVYFLISIVDSHCKI